MAKTLDFLFNLDVAMSNGFQQPMRILNGEMGRATQAIQNLQRASSNITGYQKQSAKLTELRGKLVSAQAKVRDMRTAMRQGQDVDSRAFTRANEQVQKLTVSVQEGMKKLGSYRAELRNAGVNVSDLAGSQDKLNSALSRLSSAQTRLSSIRETLSYPQLWEQ